MVKIDRVSSLKMILESRCSFEDRTWKPGRMYRAGFDASVLIMGGRLG